MTDWKKAKIREKVINGKLQENSNRDQNYYKEEDIDYMLNMLKFNKKDFSEKSSHG